MDAPSDLIVDVARAADPARAATVTRRLEALASSDGAASPNFASALSSAAAGSQPAANSGASPWASGGLPPVPSRSDKARIQFEATILNSFVSEMMPKDASSVYGEGYAGDMWRSLLAEKMSQEIAKSGSLNIAKNLFSGHSAALDKLETASRANAAQTNVTQMSADALSSPLGAATAEGAYLFAHGKTS